MNTPGWMTGVKQGGRTMLVALAVLAASATVRAQSAAKSIEGHVFSSASAPLPGAIVYLQDEKTNVIKTFIATKDGTYRFGQLPAGTDYEMWAEYKGEKSKKRAISSFDTKLEVTYDFHLKSN